MWCKLILVFVGAVALGELAVAQDCKDVNSYCSQWPQDYCLKYKDYMAANCARKCGHCSGPTQAPVCADKSGNCAGWKSSGYCQKDSQWHSYMKGNCALTCGFCGGGGGGGGGDGSCSGSASNKIKACKFDSDLCDWINVPFDDNHDFRVVSGGVTDGPSTGHGGSGGFLVAKGSGAARLLLPMDIVLPHSETGTSNMCLRFQYSVANGASLKIHEIQNRKGQTTTLLKDFPGDGDKNWKCGKVNVQVSTKFQVSFTASSNGNPVAIDEVSFADGSC